MWNPTPAKPPWSKQLLWFLLQMILKRHGSSAANQHPIQPALLLALDLKLFIRSKTIQFWIHVMGSRCVISFRQDLHKANKQVGVKPPFAFCNGPSHIEIWIDRNRMHMTRIAIKSCVISIWIQTPFLVAINFYAPSSAHDYPLDGVDISLPNTS